MTALKKIEKQLGVRFPDGYRAWHDCGYFDFRKQKKSYLWVHEAEWIPLAEFLATTCGESPSQD